MAGFPPETVAFLRALRANNDRAWFSEHRDLYQAAYVEPARAFVAAAGRELHAFAPRVRAEPRVDGSIYRVHRDTPLSPDDEPYKDHMDLRFWEGDRDAAVSGFFLRITPERVILGAGSHGLDGEHLVAYRAAVAHPRAGACLVDVTTDLARKGYPVHGEHYKRAPRGFDLGGERERLVRFNALWAGVDVEHPSILHTDRFLTWCVHRWSTLADLHRWLMDEVATATTPVPT